MTYDGFQHVSLDSRREREGKVLERGSKVWHLAKG